MRPCAPAMPARPSCGMGVSSAIVPAPHRMLPPDNLLAITPFARSPYFAMTAPMRRPVFLRPRWIVCALSCLLLAAVSLAARSAPVRVGLYENRPMVFLDDRGQPSGVYVDILDDIARREGWTLQYIHDNWENNLRKLEHGDIDILADIGYSDERTSRFDFTEENVFATWAQIYVRKGSDIRSYQDLEGKRIAVLTEDVHLPVLKHVLASFDISAVFEEYPDYYKVLDALSTSMADAALLSRIAGMVNEAGYDVERSPMILDPIKIHFAFPKGRNADLREAIDRHLRQMKSDRGSTLNRALAKWLPDSRSAWVPEWLKYSAALIGLALVLLFALSLILRMQVRARTAELSRKNIELRNEIAERQAAQHRRDQLVALEQEMHVGRSIQQFILHHDFPPYPGRTEFDIYAQMIPAKDVGGDFYDFFLVDEHRLGFAIGDVSGKGVPAAILMSSSRTTLRAAALQGLQPDECLRYVNTLLCETTPPNMFVSAIYAVLDTRTGDLSLSQAGHAWPCLLAPSRGPSELRGEGGIALGLIPGASYSLCQGRLEPGGAVFLYTDGVTEAMSDKDEFYGDERLCGSLSRAVGKPPREVLEQIRGDLQAFTCGAPQSDDITMLALSYYGSGGRPA